MSFCLLMIFWGNDFFVVFSCGLSGAVLLVLKLLVFIVVGLVFMGVSCSDSVLIPSIQ